MKKIRFMVVGLISLLLTSEVVFGYSGGSGIESDPYLIDGVADLLELRATTADYDKYFKMTSDIDLSGNSFTSSVIAADIDDASDFQGVKFTGCFDGDDNKILNLSIDGGVDSQYIGLFGCIGSVGEIRNLGIIYSSVVGSLNVGGLCGMNEGTIVSCYSVGSIGEGLSSMQIGGVCGYNSGTIESCYSTGSVVGGRSVGGLCGWNYYGSISNCYSKSEITAGIFISYVGGFCGYNELGRIESSYSTGSVSGYAQVGGFCGCNGGGTILSCYSTGSVSGEDLVGGFCGYNGYHDPSHGMISSCYSTGSVSGSTFVGGFCGENHTKADIEYCYSVGVVVVLDEETTLFGAFCGFSPASIVSCFYNIDISGVQTEYRATGVTTVQMQTESTFTNANWNFVDTWIMDGYPSLKCQSIFKSFDLQVYNSEGTGVYSPGEYVSIEYPHADIFDFFGWIVEPVQYTNNIADILSPTTTFIMPDTNVVVTAVICQYSGGTGTEADPFQIATKKDLLTLGNYLPYYDKYFKMTADIDMSGTNFTSAIIASNTNSFPDLPFQGTKFTGVFDGNSKKILNLSIDGGSTASYIGLFGYIEVGRVKNLEMLDCNIIGVDYVGSICGRNDATMKHCYSTGSVSGTNNVGGLCGYNGGGIDWCHTIGTVSGYNYIGGLCGRSYTRSAIESCYSTCTVSGNNYVGGITGSVWDGDLSRCYSTGSVNGQEFVGGLSGQKQATFRNCYSAARVSGVQNVGGLCGGGGTTSAFNCFWDLETSGQSTSFGGIGKTTAQMQTKSTFSTSNWSFVYYWAMDGYPVLTVFDNGTETYQTWLDDLGVPSNKQAYTDSPAGDKIQNLVKYAVGLNPMDVCSTKDVIEFVADETNGISIVYNKAKGTEDLELFPIWSDSLLLSNWNSDGFEFEVISQTDSNATWKATHSATGECGYIRLKAQIED